MSPGDLWRLACGIRDGHIRIAGPWTRYRPDADSFAGNPGMYRPTHNGSVAVRTEHSVDWDGGTKTRWAEGSAGLWTPAVYPDVRLAREAADAFLARTGWIVCNEDGS